MKMTSSSKRYMAVQINAAYFIDSKINMSAMGSMLSEISLELNTPIVFFRAGSVHDSIQRYIDLAKHFSPGVVYEFMENLNIWMISALISQATLLVSTSLHTRIVAYAFQVPRFTLLPGGKQRQFIDTIDTAAPEIRVSLSPRSDKEVQKGSNYIIDTMKNNAEAFKNKAHYDTTMKKYMNKVLHPMASLLIESGCINPRCVDSKK